MAHQTKTCPDQDGAENHEGEGEIGESGSPDSDEDPPEDQG